MDSIPDNAEVITVENDDNLYMYPVMGEKDNVVEGAWIESDCWFSIAAIK